MENTWMGTGMNTRTLPIAFRGFRSARDRWEKNLLAAMAT